MAMEVDDVNQAIMGDARAQLLHRLEVEEQETQAKMEDSWNKMEMNIHQAINHLAAAARLHPSPHLQELIREQEERLVDIDVMRAAMREEREIRERAREARRREYRRMEEAAIRRRRERLRRAWEEAQHQAPRAMRQLQHVGHHHERQARQKRRV